MELTHLVHSEYPFLDIHGATYAAPEVIWTALVQPGMCTESLLRLSAPKCCGLSIAVQVCANEKCMLPGFRCLV